MVGRPLPVDSGITIEMVRKNILVRAFAVINHEISYTQAQKKSLEIMLDAETLRFYEDKGDLTIDTLDDYLRFRDSVIYRIRACDDLLRELSGKKKEIARQILFCRKKIQDIALSKTRRC